LNKGNKSFSRKWPENWNGIYPQTFENVYKIALTLKNCTTVNFTFSLRQMRVSRFVEKMKICEENAVYIDRL